ncbi:MAG: NusA-like transcription termination signal-binding factor [Canidatus Methanoxibalbensis ujae]|nr:NusA-like transcription termination signal-binding factor [Candidatus Methanoxibalbensis ujae]MCW7078618.1 NusA-like transcription termination signal-binding factor [Candidatus Methanoxibalbensis ujae]
MTLKLNTENIRYINIFEDITGTRVKDCIVDNEMNKIIIVVEQGKIGRAIGKGGSNIKKIKRLLNKNIEIIEYSSDIMEFITNIMGNICVKNVRILEKNGKKCVYIEVPQKEKGIAIGKRGQRIKKVKMLLRRNQNIDDVVIS